MRKVHFSVHPLALTGLFLLFCLLPREKAFAALSSVLLHEAGHTVAACLYHRRIEKVTVMPVGLNLSLSPPASYREEIVTAVAGPLVNLLYLAAVPLLPASLASQTFFCSAVLALLNFLPIRTLDGGRVLFATLASLFGVRAAERTLSVTSAFSLFCLWIPALYIFFYSGANFTLLLFCSYLFAYLIVKNG